MTNDTEKPGLIHIRSIGGKLAGATFVLIAIAASFSYVKVTGSERDHLLRAKEVGASAVTRLFADSCAAAVVFDDAEAVKVALTTLGRNEEIEYAAVWAPDRAGKLTRQLGELRRGPVASVVEVPPAVRLRREAARVVLTSPIRDENDKPFAAAVVTFSLARENAAIARAQKTTLVLFSLISAGAMVVLMLMVRMVIVGPLGKLVAAARELERGGSGKVDVHTSDEVGQLARAFRSMATAITVREGRIQARNRDMRLLLDNAGQGFISLDSEGTMSEKRSRIIDEWFGPAEDRPKFWDYLGRIDPKLGEWFEVGWDAVRERVLPVTLCLEQLPALAHKGAQTFELAYRPLMEGERLDKTIVVITDVTARIERERAEQGQREMMSIFRRARSDRPALDQLFTEVSALIGDITAGDGADLVVLRRQIHTVKGNCGLFGIESVASFCHTLEDRMSTSAEGLFPDEKQTLRLLWTRAEEMRAQLVEGGPEGGVELDRAEYAAMLAALRGRLDHDLLLATAASWRFEPAARRLELIGEQLQHLAERLGKAPTDVVREPTNLRLPPGKWGPFWAAFAHVVRNTVDHGIDTAIERAASGKGPRATVTLGVARERQGDLVVSIRDDGPGIDWPGVAARARALGLPHATPAELEAALFAGGVSSRADVTATSGRGVGLSAVHAVVSALGGRIEVQTDPGRGTCFRFVFPQAMLVDEPPPVWPGDGKESAVYAC